MTPTTSQASPPRTADEPSRGGVLRPVLVAVIALALVVVGGGLAVGLGVGRTATPTADSVDAGFSRDMARHHLQGVEMANLVAERSQDPAVQRIGFDISSTQTNQVGQMQGWLTLWHLPLTSSTSMAWMGDRPGHAMDMGGAGVTGLMPGMATEEELAQLRTLSGTPFDVRFLQLMIRHHEGGLGMAQYAAAHADVDVVANLAGTIAAAQTAEVATMTDMLAAKGGAPLPAP